MTGNYLFVCSTIENVSFHFIVQRKLYIVYVACCLPSQHARKFFFFFWSGETFCLRERLSCTANLVSVEEQVSSQVSTKF